MFRGTCTALCTPFKKGDIDLQSLRRLIDYNLQNGVEALLALGTTGESATMTMEEKESVLTTAREMHKGPLMVGTGTNCTTSTIEATNWAFDCGADMALVVTPYYNKPTQNGLYEHYTAIAQASKGPIVLYNVPGRTGCRLNHETIAKLAMEQRNIIGIKDATGDLFGSDLLVRYVKEARPDFYIWSGNDDLAFHMTNSGCDGVISVVSNVAPKTMSDMVHASLCGEVAKARELHLSLLNLCRDLFIETNPCPVKYGAKLLGFGDGSLKLPLAPVLHTTEEAVKADLIELGLL